MRRRIALVLLAAVAALGATASAAMEGDPPTLDVRLSDGAVAFGAEVVARGRVSAGGAGQVVLIEQRQGPVWTRVAGTRTRANGTFATPFVPSRGGALRARLAESGATSAEVALRVRPRVSIAVREGRAFLGAPLVLRVRPAAYDGRVAVKVRQAGRRVGVAHGQVEDGALRLRVPTPGVGRFRVRVVLEATEAFAGGRASGRVTAGAEPIGYGSSGPEVEALLHRLAELRYHVPEERDVFGPEAVDAVLAFQKANGLTRDGAVGEEAWRALGQADPPEPRYAKPALHIEVDKTRQILMVVRDGEVESVVSASTGVTGNTPEGAFRILWKSPATTTWLGPGLLYRTLTFLGNEFAIHGYPSVPAYPASHGCVRVPMWVADWLYQRSPVGERIYIYR